MTERTAGPACENAPGKNTLYTPSPCPFAPRRGPEPPPPPRVADLGFTFLDLVKKLFVADPEKERIRIRALRKKTRIKCGSILFFPPMISQSKH